MFHVIFVRNNIKYNLLNTKRNLGYFSQNVSLLKPAQGSVIRNLRISRFFGSSSARAPNLRSNGSLFVKQRYNFKHNTKQFSIEALDINTNITNNIYLYRYVRDGFYTFINTFAPIQLFIWMGIAYAFHKLSSPKKPETSVWNYLKENYMICIVSYTMPIMGVASMFMLWIFSIRSIKYAILHKGGNMITLVTYHPLKKHAIITVPVNETSCKVPRNEMRHYLTMRIKGRKFFYILDAKGEFFNSLLFDRTIGMQRNVE